MKSSITLRHRRASAHNLPRPSSKSSANARGRVSRSSNSARRKPGINSGINRPPQRSEQQARAWQQQRGWGQRGAWQGQQTWQQSRARSWANEHRSWTQRGGYGGYYIPQNRFSISSGRQHYFRLRSRPIIYQGYPRFDYGGFSFLMVDPWPEYWSENWYDSDDVYIDYDDGYYLYNPHHPQVRLGIYCRDVTAVFASRRVDSSDRRWEV